MAIHNPSNLYSGNAGIFNSTPYTNFAINQLAQKQAKDESIDKYYSDQFSKLNGAGLAPSEQEAVQGTKNNLMDFYMKNKDAIHKGDIDAMTGVNQYLSKMQDIIGRGKYKTEDNKGIQRIMTTPNSASRLTDNSRQGIDAANAPIYKKNDKGDYELNSYDPISNPTGYKNFDYNQHLFNEEPYTQMQMQQRSENYAKNLKPDNVAYQPLTLPDGTQSKTQMQAVSSYSPDAKKQILADNEKAYNQDDKLSYTVDKGHPFAQLKDEHANDFNQLNDLYKQSTGKDITTGGGLFAASELQRMLSPKNAEKPIVNQDAKAAQANDYANQRAATNDARIRSRMIFGAGLKKTEKNAGAAQDASAVLRDVYDKINSGEQSSDRMNTIGSKFFGDNTSKEPIQIADANLLKTFSNIKKVGSTPVPPDKVIYDKNKDQFLLYYNSPMKGVEDSQIPLSAREYMKLKVKETYPSKDVGTINKIVDQFINDKGNLYDALQQFDPSKQQQAAPVKSAPVKTVTAPKVNSSKVKKSAKDYGL